MFLGEFYNFIRLMKGFYGGEMFKYYWRVVNFMSLSDLMQIGAVWGTEDPSTDRFGTYTLFREDKDIFALTGDSVLNFPEMQSRRVPISQEELFKRLISREGFEPANIGISAYLTLSQGDDKYLVLVEQLRKDFPDETGQPITVSDAKLPSEYWNINISNTPAVAMMYGLEEEVKFVRDGEVLGFYPDIGLADEFREPNALPGSTPRFVRDVVSDRFYGVRFDASHSAAQIIIPFHLRAKSLEGITAFHLEDEFNPETKQLDAKYNGSRLYFIPLREGKLVPEAYRLQEGKFVPAEFPPFLSEAFLPTDNGITSESRIASEDYFGLSQ
jgi:hypothetical protein